MAILFLFMGHGIAGLPTSIDCEVLAYTIYACHVILIELILLDDLEQK